MLNKTIYDVNDIEGFLFFETITCFFFFGPAYHQLVWLSWYPTSFGSQWVGKTINVKIWRQRPSYFWKLPGMLSMLSHQNITPTPNRSFISQCQYHLVKFCKSIKLWHVEIQCGVSDNSQKWGPYITRYFYTIDITPTHRGTHHHRFNYSISCQRYILTCAELVHSLQLLWMGKDEGH